jgi:acetylornithine deacetylase
MSKHTFDLAINRDFLVETLADLVRINSVNPSLADGAPGEAEIGAYIAATLRGVGVPEEILEVERGRVNVVSTIPGAGGGQSLLINAHMDTVGVGGMKEPFSGSIRDGRLYGRGAQDMKGSIAAMIAAARAIVESGVRLNGDLVLAFVADEEYESIGTVHLVEYVKTDAAIVTEPTGLDICLAHKGFQVFEFETIGRAAHGGCPGDGIDANMHMGRVLSELDTLSRSLADGERHPLVGAPSLHVPLIVGGDQLFIYSARSRISVERRTIPGESPENTLEEMEAIVRVLSTADPKFRGSVRHVLGREPYEISPEAGIVKTLGKSAERVLGKTPGFIGHSWWEDSALHGASGIETVIYGPTGHGIHTTEEWVEIDSVVSLARILTHTITEFCG